MRRAAGVVWAATSCAAAAAFAQEQPRTDSPESVAELVTALVREGKSAELAAAATKDKPDPWDVADALCDRGAFDAANAFARAAPRVAVEALPGYVASARQLPKAGEGRRRLREATASLDGGHAEEALANVDDSSGPAETELPRVPALRLRRVRGLALDKLTRHAEALAALQSAADDADKAGWLTFAVRCRIDAAQSMQAAGDLAATQAEWARIVALRERLGDRPGVGRALSNVGSFASMRGDYRGAIGFLERAAAAFEGLSDKPEYRSMAGQVLGNCGIVSKVLGRYAQSFGFLERACDLQRASGDRVGWASSLTQLGQLHYETGALNRAVECETEACRIATEAGAEVEIAAASGALGVALARLGRFDAAREALERTRDIRRKRGEVVGAALAERSLARVARKSGDLARAAELVAVAERDIASSPDRREIISVRLELGAIRLAACDAKAALAAFETAAAEAEAGGYVGLAIDAQRGASAAHLALGHAGEAVTSARRALEHARRLAGGLAATQLTDLRADSAVDFDEVEIGRRAAAQVGDAEALCLFLEHGRAAVVLQSLARSDADRLRDAAVAPELRAQEATLREDEAACGHRLSQALAGGNLAEIRARRADADAARAAVATVVGRIQRESLLAAAVLYPEPADLARIRSALRPEEALVSFASAGDETVALVVTPDSARIARLGPTEPLRVACAAFDSSRASVITDEAIRSIRRAVVDPLALDGAVRRLLVVPDGPAAGIPFVLLTPEMEIAYLPSATTLVLLSPQRELSGSKVLALGDPDLSGSPGEGVAPLPAARVEACTVGDRVLLGADATEAALRRVLREDAASTPARRWRAVHFACHAVIDLDQPWLSALLLAPGDGHDGRLTALDVIELPLRTDLAVLSACRTARGRVVRGDGVVGLSRAFLAAGAPRVLVSLWKVDDAATAELMKRFHAAWKDGRVSAASALTNAQAAVRADKRWADPVYWAAWQLWGLPD